MLTRCCPLGFSASAAQAQRVLRPSTWGTSRPSIIDRGEDFFVRYGEKEREAVASFDFLDEMVPSSSACSDAGSEQGSVKRNDAQIEKGLLLTTTMSNTMATTMTMSTIEIDDTKMITEQHPSL